MLNTANLKLTNFIDPELTWKTVTKRIRTAYGRCRKPARTLNVGVQQDDKSTKSEESSISESEKLGVAILGRRFAEKIDHVPFKKRRLPLQSPSTPPQIPSHYREESLSSQPWTSSPQPEDFDQTVENKCVSGQWWGSSVSSQEMGAFNGPVAVEFHQSIENAFVNGRLSEVSDGKLGHTGDFSGIELLAAAACNSCISDDAHNRNEGPMVDDFLISGGIVTLISATPLARATTSSESGNLFLKEWAHKDNVEDSVVEDSSVVVSRNFLDERESEGGTRSSKKDDRLHWDLNTVMEAWELPCDDLIVGSQRNGSESIPDQSVHSENPEKLEGCVRYIDPENPSELLKDSSPDIEVSTRVISDDKSLDTCPSLGSEPISNRPLSGEKINTSPTSVVIQTREAHCGTSAMKLSQKVFIENVHLGLHDFPPFDMAVSDKVVWKSDSMQSLDISLETFDLPHIRTLPTELVGSATCLMSDMEYSLSKSRKSGISSPVPEQENSPGLDTTLGGGQPIVTVDVEMKQDKEAPTANAILMDSLLHVETKKLMPKTYECFGNVDVADPIDDGHALDVSHSGHRPPVCVGKMTQIQVGYDSPFEDGELRESVVYSCEENDVEGETVYVDYDSGFRDGDEFGAANQCMSEVGSDSCLKDKKRSSPEKELQCGRANSLKESSHSLSLNKFSGQNQLREGCEGSTERTGKANNIITNKKFVSESMDGPDVEGSSAGEVGSRAIKGNLLSHVDESSCSDALHRKDNVDMQRDRSGYESSFQAGRIFGSEKYLERDRPTLPLQHRNQGDSRNHYHSGYPRGTGHPRPRGVIASSGAKIDGLTYHDQRRYTNFSSKGEYRPLIRRRSPADSDDAYSAPRRMVAARDSIHHIRRRGRGRIYRQGYSRVPGEEYDGPLSNNPASSSARLPHYLSRRERSFSPVLSRDADFSRFRRKSRSRSRSRSPLTWNMQRERNMWVRRLSRSPDFRSEARMGRARMPFQKSNYAADDEDAFKSPPRTRFSPQRNTRWIDDQDYVPAHFRERKPTGRLFGWSQKFDSGGSPGRIKSDKCFRSMIRPGRFTEHSGGGGDREHKYDGGNCERTKYLDKYEKIHGVRRCNSSVVMRQFRYDVEDCFDVQNTRNVDSCIKGTDKRDIPRSTREEISPLRYSNERIYASVSKLSRIRDSNEDVSPRRG